MWFVQFFFVALQLQLTSAFTNPDAHRTSPAGTTIEQHLAQKAVANSTILKKRHNKDS